MLASTGETAQSRTTRYVSDQITVTMRAGRTTEYKVIKELQSGDPVEVLQVDEEKGYTKVRVDGEEGWILSRFLIDTPSARSRLAIAEQELAKLKQATQESTTTIEQLTLQNKQAQKKIEHLIQENTLANQELERVMQASAKSLALLDENKKLRKLLTTMQEDLSQLQQEKAELLGRTFRDGLLVGGGILAFGLFLGLILPRIRWKKRNSWDSL